MTIVIDNTGADTANGIVLYEGPSMLDGAPIVVIATGITRPSVNVKTGPMVQVWIMRADINPIAAINSGDDASICGACPHRGVVLDIAGKLKNSARSCYVEIGRAPRNVFESYHRGIYARVDADTARRILSGRRVRVGAYGDPAAAPVWVWENALADAEDNTGYTHQWRTCDAAFARFVMASCDSEADYLDAKARGYRTFRVRGAGEALQAREINCPSPKTTCFACRACGGTSAKARVDIAIEVHGTKANINAFNSKAA